MLSIFFKVNFISFRIKLAILNISLKDNLHKINGSLSVIFNTLLTKFIFETYYLEKKKDIRKLLRKKSYIQI